MSNQDNYIYDGFGYMFGSLQVIGAKIKYINNLEELKKEVANQINNVVKHLDESAKNQNYEPVSNPKDLEVKL